MRPSLRSALPRIAVIVLVALVVVVAATVIPPAVAPSDDIEPVENPAYDLSTILPEEPEATGDVSVAEAPDRGTVLIDLAHGNRLTEEEIQPLTTAIRDAGYRVEFLDSGRELDEKLSEADAFVVIDPGEGYTDREVDTVESFVEKGGRLALFGEPTQGAIAGPLVGIAVQTNHLESIADPFGIDFDSGYLFNMRDNDGIYQNVFANATSTQGVVSGVDRVAMYLATRVSARDGRRILVTGDGTRLIRGDAPGQYSVGVRTGNVLAFGDATFLTGGNYQVVDNDRLIGNVVSFLVEGERRRTLLDFPANVEDDPSIRYSSAGLLEAAQTLGEAFRGGGDAPGLVLEDGEITPGETDVLLATFDDLANRTSPGTGVQLSGDRVSVPGYSADQEDVTIVHTPAGSEIDVVIAADTVSGAEDAATALAEGTLAQYAISNSTLVLTGDTDGGFG